MGLARICLSFSCYNRVNYAAYKIPSGGCGLVSSRHWLAHGGAALRLASLSPFRKFEETGDSKYQLCALATVERKVRQIDLWQDKNLLSYTKYFSGIIPLQWFSAQD